MSDKLDAQLRAFEMMGGNTKAILDKAGVTEPTQQNVETPAAQAPTAEVVEIDTPLVKKKFSTTEAPQGEDFRDFNVLSNYAKQNGFELKDANDLKAVFDSYSNAVKEKEQLAEKASKADYLEGILNNLPKEIANPFAVYLNKGDYIAEMKKIASSPFDLNKEFSSYGDGEVKKIIDHYYPGKYDSEKWEDMDDDMKDNVREAVSLKYASDRNSFLTTQSRNEESILQKRDLLKQSIDNSIINLKKNNPQMKDAEIKEIERAMHGGLNEKLYNADGTYRQDAAEQISYVIFGKQTIETLQSSLESKMQQAINKEVGRANEEIVNRYSDKAPLKQGGDDPNVIGQIVKEKTNFLKKNQLFQD